VPDGFAFLQIGGPGLGTVGVGEQPVRVVLFGARPGRKENTTWSPSVKPLVF
jgi:hypothetical protein